MKATRLYTLFALLLMAIVLNGCKKPQPLPEGEVIEKPTVQVVEDVMALSFTTATISAEVMDDGNGTVTEQGFCYNRIGTTPDTVFCGNGKGRFSATLTDLLPNTTYHFMAFATNEAGTGVSDKATFTTPDYALPEVNTVEITLVTLHSAVSGGNIVNDGGSPVTECGVCWATSPDPTLDDNHLEAESEMDNFCLEMTNLLPETQYYVRAYATNEKGTAYGNEVSFSTLEYGFPEVSTVPVTDITESSAKSGGIVLTDGDSPVTERGVCWSTAPIPSIESDYLASGEGLGSFICLLDDLSAHTTYYLRAYATNGKGTNYGEEVQFITSAIPPTVTTIQVTDIEMHTAVGHGQVLDDGGDEVTERGFCWSISPSPNLDGNHVECGSGIGTFSANLTNLEANTNYHVRTYSANAKGTSYGEEIQFKTTDYAPAQVITLDATEITDHSALCGGQIVSDGGHPIIERGICWNISGNPTIGHFHVVATENTAIFTCPMDDLQPNYTYHVRAYFKTERDITYGNEISFNTSGALSTVNINDIVLIVSPIAHFFAQVTNSGGSYVTERGICWSTNPFPTIDDPHIADAETGVGTYSGYVNRLTPHTTYYFRAFAINGSGISYSSSRELFTDKVLPDGPEGSLKGFYTVGQNKRVRFSKGNLQCKISRGNTSKHLWRFAEHQYDYIGEANANVNSSYPDWFDLFGWGTSGWDCGNIYYQPYERRGGNYGPNFGPPHPNNLTGEYARSDWGIDNAISNGGNAVGQWRTLTKGEWEYLLNNRLYNNGFDCWVKAQVNHVNGVIVLPDNWNQGYFPLTGYNQWISTTYCDNIISATDWENTFEALGVVFLPAAGQCQGHEALMMNEKGFYWSSSHYNNFQQFAYDMGFDEQRVQSSVSEYKHYCLSVRLVQDE